MSEMLTEMVPGQEDTSDYELLQARNRSCLEFMCVCVFQNTIALVIFLNVYLCTMCVFLGAEQDLSIHATEDSGTHLLCLKRSRDRGAAARQRRPQQHLLALRKVRPLTVSSAARGTDPAFVGALFENALSPLQIREVQIWKVYSPECQQWGKSVLQAGGQTCPLACSASLCLLSQPAAV